MRERKMKQIIQNYRTGKLELAEVPIPLCSSNKILVKNIASLISIGTERSILELGRKSLLGKAKARPDLVKRFIDKAKNEGFIKTYKEALGRLDNPTPLGYSSAGIVVKAGKGVPEFSPGDRVACIGAGYAGHAEYISIPAMLCCKVPEPVSFEEASFGMLGIIALHGIRCADLSFGSSVVVIGLGLIGLLTVQILKAYGCRVIGTDIDPAKLELAKKLGADVVAEDAKLKAQSDLFTQGVGVDAVIITAATKSDRPVNMGVDIVRFRGKIVLVGVADVHPQRNEMWHKEVEIVVSRAGGPGTFDPFYENKGMDYPIGYVRWTENRNLKEFMRLLSEGKVDVRPLITHRFPIAEALDAYEGFSNGTIKNCIGIVLNYPEESLDDNHRIFERRISLKKNKSAVDTGGRVNVGVIGAGLFGKALLLPALKEMRGITLKMLATSSSANAYHAGKKYGFEECTTDYHEILNNDEISAIIILTPHSLHARMVSEALQAGKHVFVEKPLCLNEEELIKIKELATDPHRPAQTFLPDDLSAGKMSSFQEINDSRITMPLVMVGYNRRFSPHAVKISEYLAHRQDPIIISYRVNAGFVPPDHWVHAEEQGGGRIIGEICHFVDFIQFLTGANPTRVFAERISGNNQTAVNNDNIAINLKFADGSVGNIVYSASGDKASSRERIETFCEGKTIVSTDFKKTYCHFKGKKKSFNTHNQSMGYKEELQHFFDVVKGHTEPKLTIDEIFYSTLTVFKIHESLQAGEAVEIEEK